MKKIQNSDEGVMILLVPVELKIPVARISVETFSSH